MLASYSSVLQTGLAKLACIISPPRLDLVLHPCLDNDKNNNDNEEAFQVVHSKQELKAPARDRNSARNFSPLPRGRKSPTPSPFHSPKGRLSRASSIVFVPARSRQRLKKKKDNKQQSSPVSAIGTRKPLCLQISTESVVNAVIDKSDGIARVGRTNCALVEAASPRDGFVAIGGDAPAHPSTFDSSEEAPSPSLPSALLPVSPKPERSSASAPPFPTSHSTDLQARIESKRSEVQVALSVRLEAIHLRSTYESKISQVRILQAEIGGFRDEGDGWHDKACRACQSFIEELNKVAKKHEAAVSTHRKLENELKELEYEMRRRDFAEGHEQPSKKRENKRARYATKKKEKRVSPPSPTLSLSALSTSSTDSSSLVPADNSLLAQHHRERDLPSLAPQPANVRNDALDTGISHSPRGGAASTRSRSRRHKCSESPSPTGPAAQSSPLQPFSGSIPPSSSASPSSSSASNSWTPPPESVRCLSFSTNRTTTLGNGSCCPNGVSEVLCREECISEERLQQTSFEIRSAVAETARTLRSNSKLLQLLKVAPDPRWDEANRCFLENSAYDPDQEEDLDEILEQFAREGQWFGTTQLSILASILRIPIALFSPAGPTSRRFSDFARQIFLPVPEFSLSDHRVESLVRSEVSTNRKSPLPLLYDPEGHFTVHPEEIHSSWKNLLDNDTLTTFEPQDFQLEPLGFFVVITFRNVFPRDEASFAVSSAPSQSVDGDGDAHTYDIASASGNKRPRRNAAKKATSVRRQPVRLRTAARLVVEDEDYIDADPSDFDRKDFANSDEEIPTFISPSERQPPPDLKWTAASIQINPKDLPELPTIRDKQLALQARCSKDYLTSTRGLSEFEMYDHEVDSYRTLEWLGDGKLHQAYSEGFYKLLPRTSPGILSVLRDSLETNATQSHFGWAYGLDQTLLAPPDPPNPKATWRPLSQSQNIVADLFEGRSIKGSRQLGWTTPRNDFGRS
ncbi:hypothetical protein JCM5350_008333 [Sporobolomyces pararoseus]